MLAVGATIARKANISDRTVRRVIARLEAEIFAEADAIDREQARQDAAARDDEMAYVDASSYAATSRRVATAAAKAGDIELAAAICLDLSGHQPGSEAGVIELANGPRDSYGRYARACGSLDDFGRCGERYHSAGCGAVLESAAASGSAESAAAWNGAIAHRAGAMVINGSVAYESTDGSPWTVRDAVYASMGIAPRQSFFETGHGKPEAPEPRRTLAYGDPDDPASGKYLMQPDRDLAARLGLHHQPPMMHGALVLTGSSRRRSAAARPARTWKDLRWKAPASCLRLPLATRLTETASWAA